jgi:hypothetical protein
MSLGCLSFSNVCNSLQSNRFIPFIFIRIFIRAYSLAGFVCVKP